MSGQTEVKGQGTCVCLLGNGEGLHVNIQNGGIYGNYRKEIDLPDDYSSCVEREYTNQHRHSTETYLNNTDSHTQHRFTHATQYGFTHTTQHRFTHTTQHGFTHATRIHTRNGPWIHTRNATQIHTYLTRRPRWNINDRTSSARSINRNARAMLHARV